MAEALIIGVGGRRNLIAEVARDYGYELYTVNIIHGHHTRLFDDTVFSVSQPGGYNHLALTERILSPLFLRPTA